VRAITNPVAALLEPGYRVDRYELLAKIGQGGMASVWLARAENGDGNAFFAIKTILPEHAGDDQLRKMMLDEARIAMGIDHPNVARTLEVGQLWDMPYLVLEYVPGESLDQLCQALENRGATMPPEIAVRLVVDTCAGLQAAHELNGPNGKSLEIVHRDLSTHNILVDDLGHVKLIDFGIAKANARLTETASGLTKGKIPYMAPEQALGGFVDRRADLWSLGAVLYVLLTGKYPFDGANDATRLMEKLSGDPPTPLPDSVPAALRAVVDRTLSFYREARYSSATELAAALDAAVPKASAEDVAAFFRVHLSPGIKARKHIVEHALAAANARNRARELLSGTATPASFRRAAAKAAQATTGVDEGPSVATIGRDPRSRSKPWLAYVSVAVIALIILIAFVLGTATGRGGATTPSATNVDSATGATAAAVTVTPVTSLTPVTPATVPSLAIPSAKPSAAAARPAHPPATARPTAGPVHVAVPSVTPPPRPSASASAKKPLPEDTIF
jgi:eukaryotic-like serine/threonine-protein kinase